MILRPWGIQEPLSALLHMSKLSLRADFMLRSRGSPLRAGISRRLQWLTPFQMVSGCPLKGLQCSGFQLGTEKTVDRWPSTSSAICSQELLLYRSWALGLLLISLLQSINLKTEVSKMKGCSRLNNLGAPSGQSTVQDLLRIRLTEFTCNSWNCCSRDRDDPLHGCHCNVNVSFRMRCHN